MATIATNAPNRSSSSNRSSYFSTSISFIALFLLAIILLSSPRYVSAQSAAEWGQIKAKCGLPSGTIYNTWVAQGAPCNQSSAAPNVAATQQQLATQVAATGGKMIGEGLHDLLFGKPESPEHQQLRIAAQQLNNSGVWYMRRNDYANAIVEFQKALQKTPYDSTIIANLTLARRLQEQTSRNNAVVGQNSDALANVMQSIPAATRTPAWDQPQNLFHNIDVNFTSNTVNLQNVQKSSVDPATMKKDNPPSGQPLQSKEDLNTAFDKAVQSPAATQSDRQQLDSEFDNLVAPAGSNAAPPQSPAQATRAKRPAPKPHSQPAPATSQTSPEKP